MHAMVMSQTGLDPATSVAVESFLAHHPDARVTVVLCNPFATRTAVAGVEALSAHDLEVDGLRFIDLLMAGGPRFARWAAVPAAIALADPNEPTLVLPDHSWTLAPLDDVFDLVGPKQIGLLSTSVDLGAGTATDGWLADVAVIGAEASAALDWWARAAGSAARSTTPGIDPDRPWERFVDAGPAVVALRDPSLRFAPRTAGEISLAGDATDITTDGTPLRLVHFPGFDPEQPWWFSDSPTEEPRLLASDSPSLRWLGRAYAEQLRRRPDRRAPETTTNLVGIEITPAIRRGFRTELLAATSREDGGHPLPNPFDPTALEAFFAWLAGPGERDGTGVSRIADFIWQDRPDLAPAFPHVRWSDRERFLRWLWTHGLAEGLISTALLPPAPRPVASTTQQSTDRIFGVNLVGYHDAELGLGVAVRRVGAALDAARIPWKPVSYDRTHSRNRAGSETTLPTDGTDGTDGTDEPAAAYWFNLILVAPDQLQFFAEDVGGEFFANHYNIALWYWETDVMTPHQQAAFAYVDEVWGATRFLAETFAAHTSKPVIHLPVPLEFEETKTASVGDARTAAGLDDRFTFLFSFDFLSIVQRKNPLDLVEAFCRAFSVGDRCRLILKSINGDLHLREAEEIRAAIDHRPDIELRDGYVDGPDRIALVGAVDCYISLHRSEGLGLTMAEAMAAGTPVIATGYSGNMDFTTAKAALLVDFEEIEIGEGSFYPAEGHWAQPDLDHAAHQMRRIHDDADLRDQLIANARGALLPFTIKRVGAQMTERLNTLWE